jgi:hypothetical protein
LSEQRDGACSFHVSTMSIDKINLHGPYLANTVCPAYLRQALLRYTSGGCLRVVFLSLAEKDYLADFAGQWNLSRDYRVQPEEINFARPEPKPPARVFVCLLYNLSLFISLSIALVTFFSEEAPKLLV